MGRWPIGVSAAAALLALPLALPLTGCSPDSSGAGDTLPPLVASTTASPITGVTTSTVPVTAAPTPPPTTVMVYDAVGISQTFGAATVRVLVDHCGVTAGASGWCSSARGPRCAPRAPRHRTTPSRWPGSTR